MSFYNPSLNSWFTEKPDVVKKISIVCPQLPFIYDGSIIEFNEREPTMQEKTLIETAIVKGL